MNQTNRTNRSRRIFAAAVALGWVLVTVTQAGAQTIASPPTPTLITPPVGNVAFLVGHAVGTQGYVCLPKGTGASWTVNNARPEATLFANLFGLDVQIITHFFESRYKPQQRRPRSITLRQCDVAEFPG